MVPMEMPDGAVLQHSRLCGSTPSQSGFLRGGVYPSNITPVRDETLRSKIATDLGRFNVARLCGMRPAAATASRQEKKSGNGPTVPNCGG